MYNKGHLIVELKVIPPTSLDEKSIKSLQEINEKILDKKTNQ